MKHNKGKLLIVILLFIGLAFTQGINAKYNITINDNFGLNTGNHPPIYIDGNDDFTSENGVTGGSGTEEDPFIIDNWVIESDGSTSEGVFINNTNAFFVIRNCSAYNYSAIVDGIGILLSYVENGRIESTTTYGNYYGIMVRDNSAYIEINNCSSGYSDEWNSRGIICLRSSYITITSSKFHDIETGIFFEDTPYGIIQNSSIYNCIPYGIWIVGRETAHDYIIKNCRIFNNGYGISICMDKHFYRQSGNIHISNCEIYNNGRPQPNESTAYCAIHILHLHGNIIENCSIHHNGNGIGLAWSTDNIIRNCSIFNHRTNGNIGAMGINFYNLALISHPKAWLIGNRIINCDIYNNDIGLLPETGKTVIQMNNVFNNSWFGLGTGLFCRIKMNYNNIQGNGFEEASEGVIISRISYADLRNNWWGAEDGPDTFLNRGSGDTIYHYWLGISRFRPWATEPIPDAGVN